MALISYYAGGTASVANGDTSVTGSATQWAVAVREGDVFWGPDGVSVRIASVEAAGALTLAFPWPGAALVDSAYEIRLTPVASSITASVRELLEKLRQGLWLTPNATGTLAERDAYDSARRGFIYMQVDVDPFVVFVKLTDTAADWSPGFSPQQGPAGPYTNIEAGTVTTLAPDAPATVSEVSVGDVTTLNFGIPAGTGFYFEGPYDGGTTYAKDDVVTTGGSAFIALQETTGNAPNAAADTAFWARVAVKGQDGTGVGDMVIATYDPQGVGADAFDRANHTGTQAIASVAGLQGALDEAGVVFASKATAVAYAPVVAPGFIRLVGYYSAGDGGAALYKTAASEPTHAGKFSITLADAVTVQWYELAEKIANILVFGARHTEANNSPMIQNAIDYSATMKGGCVYFPSPPEGQTYNITATLNVTKKVILRGEHMDVTLYANFAAASTAIFTCDGTVSPNQEHVLIEKLTLRSNTTTRASGVYFNNVALISMRDVIVYDCYDGIYITGNRSFSNKFDNVQVFPKASRYGVYYTSFTGGGHHLFTGCTFCAATGFMVAANSTIDALHFVNPNFEKCDLAMNLAGGYDGISMDGPRFEKNGQAGGLYSIYINPPAGYVNKCFTINGGFAETDGEAHLIQQAGAGTTFNVNVTGMVMRDFTGSLLRCSNGNYSGGLLAGNHTGGSGTHTFSSSAGNAAYHDVTMLGNRKDGGVSTQP